MAKLGPEMWGSILVLVATSTFAAGTADVQCRSGCGGVVSQTFKFAEGTTYQYNFEGAISVLLSSAKGQDIETKVKATVLLTQQSECNQVLRLQNVQILGEKRLGSVANIEKPIRLNYHDGHLEDIICTEAGDTIDSLNVKRAVASMFQAALKHHNMETDVFGSCPTEFSTHKDGNVFVIKKARNLNKCAHREGISQDYMSFAFDIASDMKSSPILQGKYSAEMKIKAGILDTSVVNEDYLYMPFSVGDEGAKVKVHSKLSFVKQTKENPKVGCTVPRSVIFEDPHTITTEKSVSKMLLEAIKDAEHNIDSTCKSDSAAKFSRVIQLMRHAKKAEIITIYAQVRSGAGFNHQPTARRIFMDALLRAGDGEAVEATMEMYKNNELTPIEARLFFFRMTFMTHSTLGSIKGATDLLDKADLPREAVVSLGAIVKKYCQQHSCESVPELNAFLDKLAGRLNKPTKETEEQVLAGLKAVLNAGRTNGAVEQKMIELAQDKHGASRIRSAALEAYKANACGEKLRDSALHILEDIQQDSELRIEAYLAVAECPNGKVATAVKTLLDKEESFQVGGFIVSHLQTLRASTNPDKMAAKSQLGNIRTTQKFPVDLLKYSRNMEVSHRWDTIGLGGSVEGNVIYSPKSYLPRSTHFNLTAQLFGRTFNFLEIDTRQENLDKLIERYLGPMGVLRKEAPQAFRDGKEGFGRISEKLKQRLQKHIVKREASKSQIETFAKTIVQKENEMNKDLDLDFTIKMFGSEAISLSLTEDVTKYTPEALIDKIFHRIDEQVDKMKTFDENLNSNVLFLDVALTYPTSTGFPLKLAIEGVSSMHLKTSGQLDLGRLCSKVLGEYKLSLIPSVNIMVTSRISADTPVALRGLKVTGNLYSATGGSLDLTITENNVDAKFSLPVKKQEILTATNEIVFESIEHGAKATEVALKQTQAKDLQVCLDRLNPYLGLTFCAVINQPNMEASTVLLPYPLNGNSKFSVTVENTDLGHIRYTLKASNTPEKAGFEDELQVLCSQGKPKTTLRTELYWRPEIYYLTTFTSPNKKAALELRAVATDKEYSVFGKASVDEIEYYGKVGGYITGTAEKGVFKPIMEYKAGTGPVQKSPYRMEGQIIREVHGEMSKYTMDNLQLVGGPKPIQVTGNVVVTSTSLATDLTLNDGATTGSFNGKIQYKDQQLSLNAMLKTSFNPEANFHIKYDVKYVPNLFDSNLQFQQGDLTKKDNVFKLQNMFKRNTETSLIPFATKNHMSYPKLGVDNKFDLDLTLKSIKMDVEFCYQKTKLNLELDAKVNTRHPGDYDIDFEFEGLGNKIDLEMARAVDKVKSKLKNSLEINGKTIKLNGDVTHQFDSNKIDFATDLNLKLTGFQHHNPDLKIVSFLKHVPQETDASLKINDGSKAIVDAFIKQSKGGNANGSIKVNTNAVTMQGQLKAAKYSGTSDLTIDVPKVKKIKAETTFNVNLPTFNVDLTVFADESKKYRISTTSVFKPESIDSKNVLDVLGKTTAFNIKGNNIGNIVEGKIDGEFDLTLPNDMYLGGKLQRERRVLKGIAGGTMFASLEQRDNKNSPGRKITLKGEGKNVNVEHSIYDILYNIILENGNGKTLNIDLDLKGTKQGDKRGIAWGSNVHGNAIGEPIKGKITASHEKKVGEYGVNLGVGKSATFDMTGKYDGGKMEMSVEAHTPLSKFKVFKMKTDGNVLMPKSKEDHFEFLNNFSLFVDDDGTDPKARIDFVSKQDWKLSVTEGTIKSMLHLKEREPLDIDISYHHDHNKKYNSKGTIKCGASKYNKWDVTVTVPSENNVDVACKIETTNEKLKSLNVNGHVKYSPETKTMSDAFDIELNGQKYTASSTVGVSEHYPTFSVELKYPDGKTDKISTKFSNVGVRSVSTKTEVRLHKVPFSFDGSLDVQAESVEDFDLKLNLDSPQLKLDKIAITATTKETKGSNKLIVSAKKANENLLSGSAVYKTREENGKFVIEGSGTFTIKNEKKTGNFKYTKTTLVAAKHKEDGVEFTIQASIGDKALDSEIKVTDKHRRALLSYCEQKKQCANMELDSKTSNEGEGGFRNIFEMNVDLRKLGMSHEFGLKSETIVKGWDLDHTVDLHFQSEKSKYSYSLYLHPKKAGATLSTPKRIVALEAKTTMPELGQKGPIEGEISLYLNKKTKPNEKTCLTFTVNPEFSQKAVNLDVVGKLIHPAFKKPMSATYKSTLNLNNPYKLEIHGVLDAPNSDKKILLDVKGTLTEEGNTLTLKHYYTLDLQPLKLKLSGEVLDVSRTSKDPMTETKYQLTSECHGKKSLFLYHELYSTEKVIDRFTFNDIVVYDFETDMKWTKEEQVVSSQVKVLGLEKRLVHLDIKNLNTLKFFVTPAATKDPKLELNAAFIPNQIADFRLEMVKGGKKLDLVHGTVKLDEANFLKSDYGFEGKHFKECLVDPIKTATQMVVEESKNAIKKTTADSTKFLEDMSKEVRTNEANVQPVADYYRKEMEAVQAELEADETLKKISTSLAGVLRAFAQFSIDMSKVIGDFTTKTTDILRIHLKYVAESFEKEILPKLKDLADKLTDASYKVFEKTNEVAFAMLEQISAFLETHKDELKQIASVVSAVTQDVNRIVVKVIQDVKQGATKEFERIMEEIKAMPYYEQIKSTIERINAGEPIPQHYIDQFQAIVNEIMTQIHIPAIKNIIDYTSKYIIKKMKREEVNDVEVILHLLEMIQEAIKEIIHTESLPTGLRKTPTTASLPTRLLTFLPKAIAVQYSFVNRVLARDFPTLEELFYGFTLNPRSWLPPFRRYAVIAQGQHIFTFDGKHMTFPGSCNYMLARDVEGKFSLVGTYAKGILTELTFFDNTDTITIKKSEAPTLNGAATELPIRTKTTDAFRLYDEVRISSKVGVRIYCFPDMSVCAVSVSGFYHGRLRGLLGNANHEPFDDFVLPSGKIVRNEGEFGNAYKMRADCAAVKTVDHSTHHHDAECTKLFTEVSTLTACFPIVKPDLFRQACDHGMAAKVPDTLKVIATAYAATCQSRYIPVFLPPQLVKCTNSEKPFNFRESFSVKVPQKAADIVFAIDVSTDNKQVYTDLVMPLGEQLKKELSERGMKDVEFHIITYGGDQPEYPSHITTNGGKMTFKGKFPNLKFSDPIEKDFETGYKQLDFTISLWENYMRDLQLAIGDTPQAFAYQEATEYPFRAHAAKAIIAVTTAPCETGALLWAQKLRAIILHDPTVSVHIFTPMQAANLKVKDEKTTKTVIGFNRDAVLTFPDCKKKPTGNADLVHEIRYNDFCSEYTVKSGGNVFVLDNFLTTSKANKKFYAQVASYNIAETLSTNELGLDCKCDYNDLLHGRNECKVASSKRKPASDRKLTRG